MKSVPFDTHITFGVYVLSYIYTLHIVLLLFLSYYSHENFVCSMCFVIFEIIIQRAKVLIENSFFYYNKPTLSLSFLFQN